MLDFFYFPSVYYCKDPGRKKCSIPGGTINRAYTRMYCCTFTNKSLAKASDTSKGCGTNARSSEVSWVKNGRYMLSFGIISIKGGIKNRQIIGCFWCYAIKLDNFSQWFRVRLKKFIKLRVNRNKLFYNRSFMFNY